MEDDDGDICWARVSDDVVPVNITCIADTPETVFQISAYNRHVEKIFDVKLIQPGKTDFFSCIENKNLNKISLSYLKMIV